MIHKYKLNDLNIVMDINSGAIHIVDDLTYEMLDNIDFRSDTQQFNALLEKYSKEEITESFSEIKMLYEKGELDSVDDFDVNIIKKTVSPIKAMCLNIAHDCNLRCEYCFAAKGDFGKGRQLMSFEIGKSAIDFLIEHSESRKNLEVDFFGGEPLMNFNVVKNIVEYARSLEAKNNKNFRFTITTNGLLLDDEKIDYINKEMSNVVLSLDGRKEINDKLRITENGSGCFDVILPKYKKLVNRRDKNKDYYIRGTFTTLNKDFTSDVLELYQQGFSQISIEPVVSDKKFDYSLQEEDLPEIFKEYEHLAKKIVEMKLQGETINFFHFFIDLNQGPCAIKRLRGCGCGNEYVAITPDGEIYPCHQFVGMDEYLMGNLNDGSFNNGIKTEMSKTTVYHKPECKECWAKFYCSGGCNANNATYRGDVLQPHILSCELEKKRLECAIMVQASLLLNNTVDS